MKTVLRFSTQLLLCAVGALTAVALAPANAQEGLMAVSRTRLKGIFVRPYGRQVSIFDGTTMQVIENIETGTGPSTVAICGNP